MIELPKKSVTRFFVPLIDVLILLFCIFLLMPFFGEPASPEAADKESPKKENPEPLPQDVKTLQEELQKARKEARDSQSFRTHLADRLSVQTIQIDPKSGKLYYYRDNERIEIPDQRAAEDVIDRHKRLSGAKEPFFLIQKPREGDGFPTFRQEKEYREWFKGVQYDLD